MYDTEIQQGILPTTQNHYFNKWDRQQVVVSTKYSFGKKGFEYFIGSEKDYEKVTPLFIILSKVSTYRKDFDETEYVPTFFDKR